MQSFKNELSWGCVSLPKPGERESGDRYLVKESDDGIVIAVIDGIGHGELAAKAAVRAVDVLDSYLGTDSHIASLLRQCHAELRGTRGVVMSILSFDKKEGLVTWLCVGNIEGILLRRDPAAQPKMVSIIQRAGIIGHTMPELHTSQFKMSPGDTLCMVTDGIHHDFVQEVSWDGAPHEIAKKVMKKYFKGTDDALVFVAQTYNPHSYDPE